MSKILNILGTAIVVVVAYRVAETLVNLATEQGAKMIVKGKEKLAS